MGQQRVVARGSSAKVPIIVKSAHPDAQRGGWLCHLLASAPLMHAGHPSASGSDCADRSRLMDKRVAGGSIR